MFYVSWEYRKNFRDFFPQVKNLLGLGHKKQQQNNWRPGHE